MSDYKMDYWKEAVSDSLEEQGLLHELPEGAIAQIAKDMINAVECQAMAFGWDCIPNPAIKEKSDEVKRYETKIKELERQIVSYRQSVATRRGVELHQVFMDDYGTVLISPR